VGNFKASIIRIAKRSNLLRWLANTTFAEVVFEILAWNLPLKYRVMRVTTRSNTLRSVAIRLSRIRKREAFPTSDETLFAFRPPLPLAIDELSAKGFCGGIVLAEECLRQILHACSNAKFVPDKDPDHPICIDAESDSSPGEGVLVCRWRDPHESCEQVDKLAHDPYLVEVARRYLGAEPVLNQTRIWWSYPHQGGEQVYTPEYGFHYDLADYMCVRLFLYLTDVNDDCGPHVVIEGTQGKKTFFEKTHRRLTDDQALARYGSKIRVLLGRQGEGFVTDCFAYHKGTNPRKRRCILQIAYSLTVQNTY